LGVYAGFYVINNFLRPFRIAASIAISKYFDEAITNIQTKTKIPRAAAIATVVFLANVVGTCTVMGGGIFLASTLAGVPIFPGK
jgi:predicted PurR-regulated permease PerM